MSTKSKAFRRILGIDFETANRYRASACSVGLFLKDVDSGTILFNKEILINPEADFEYFNTLIHGITPQVVKDEPNFCNAYNVICSLIDEDTIVVAHNAAFDMSVLRRSCERYGLSFPTFNYFCTLVFSRAIVKNLSSYALDDLVESLGLPPFNHHRALDDARACVSLFEFLIKPFSTHSIYSLSRRSGIRFGWLDKDDYKPCSVRKCFDSTVTVQSSDDADPYEDASFVVDESGPLYQKTVVFTGALSGMPRKEAEEAVAKHGGIPSANVTKSTNYLVFGYQDPTVLKGKTKSAKRIKAEKMAADGFDIQIITESDFYRLLDE